MSPMVELASESEEIEIKTIPMAIRIAVNKSNGDFFDLDTKKV